MMNRRLSMFRSLPLLETLGFATLVLAVIAG